jgi:hypothetical protein
VPVFGTLLFNYKLGRLNVLNNLLKGKQTHQLRWVPS